jgi:hypothetical protein
MNATLGTVRHGNHKPRLTAWQIEQVVKPQSPKITYRAPHFDWRSKEISKYRAGVTVYLTLKDNIPTTWNVIVARGFYRGGERCYKHVSLASLKRLSRIGPMPLLSDETFRAIELSLVADEMLEAAKELAGVK